MIRPVAFANAFTVVGIGFYAVCRILTLFVPDLLFTIGKSWFHTFSLESNRQTIPLDLGTFTLGAVSTGVLIWVLFYSGAYLYNRMAK